MNREINSLKGSLLPRRINGFRVFSDGKVYMPTQRGWIRRRDVEIANAKRGCAMNDETRNIIVETTESGVNPRDYYTTITVFDKNWFGEIYDETQLANEHAEDERSARAAAWLLKARANAPAVVLILMLAALYLWGTR